MYQQFIQENLYLLCVAYVMICRFLILYIHRYHYVYIISVYIQYYINCSVN